MKNETTLRISEYLKEKFINVPYEYVFIVAKWLGKRNVNGESTQVYMPYMQIPNESYSLFEKKDAYRKYSNVVTQESYLLTVDGLKLDFKFSGTFSNPRFEKKEQTLTLGIKSKYIFIKNMVVNIKVNNELEFEFKKEIDDEQIKNILRTDFDLDKKLSLPDINKVMRDKYYENNMVKQFLEADFLPEFDKLRDFTGEYTVSEDVILKDIALKDISLIVKVTKGDLPVEESFWQEYNKIKVCFGISLIKYNIEIKLKFRNIENDINRITVFECEFYELIEEYDLNKIAQEILKI